MNIFKLLFFLTISLLSTACVSRMSDADEKYAQNFPTPKSGHGGLYVAREYNFIGGGKAVDLYVDTQRTAELGSGDFYYTELPVGSHTLQVAIYDWLSALVTGGDGESEYFKVKIEENKNKFIQYNFFNGTFRILPEKEGKELILECDRVAQEEFD